MALGYNLLLSLSVRSFYQIPETLPTFYSHQCLVLRPLEAGVLFLPKLVDENGSIS